MAEALRLWDAIKLAAALVWENRIALSKVVAAAGLVNGVFAWLVVHDPESGAFMGIYFLGGGLVYTLLAVNVHRLVLGACKQPVLNRWTWRETRFFGWLFVIYFYMYLFYIIPLAFIVSPDEPYSRGYEWLWDAATLPGGYLFARLSPLLPATALDQKRNMGGVWKLTKGNGWRLLALLWVLPMLIAYAVPEAASDLSIMLVIWHIVFAVGTTLEVVLLSVVFKALGGLRENPPADAARANP